jgi:hypothetical protein
MIARPVVFTVAMAVGAMGCTVSDGSPLPDHFRSIDDGARGALVDEFEQRFGFGLNSVNLVLYEVRVKVLQECLQDTESGLDEDNIREEVGASLSYLDRPVLPNPPPAFVAELSAEDAATFDRCRQDYASDYPDPLKPFADWAAGLSPEELGRPSVTLNQRKGEIQAVAEDAVTLVAPLRPFLEEEG